MKILTQAEVIDTIKKSIDECISDSLIGHLNDLLTEATYKFNIDGGPGYTTISRNQIPPEVIGDGDFPIRLIANLLEDKGWDATPRFDKRSGEWIHIELPKVTRGVNK